MNQPNPPRSVGRVLDLLADVIKHSPINRAPNGVEVIRDGDGAALHIALTFADGDQWFVTAGPLEAPTTVPTAGVVHGILGGTGPTVSELAPGVTYISHGTEDQDPPHVQAARQVWPEAEAFERIMGGWTFRCGGGYASVTSAGRVAEHPQGSRIRAAHFMVADRT